MNEQGTCLLQTRANPLYNVKGEFIEGDKTQQPLEVVAALYDYKFVVEDGSKRVHDTARGATAHGFHQGTGQETSTIPSALNEANCTPRTPIKERLRGGLDLDRLTVLGGAAVIADKGVCSPGRGCSKNKA